jgi:aminocarboxymuconate-semialdehyde decarboxylase
MQAPDLAVKELRRCIQDLGLAGVEIGSHVNDWNLDAPELFPIFEEAERLGACIFIHPWDMMGKEKMPKYWLPWLVGMPAETSLAICSMIFGGVLERLPKLKVCFAHGGGSFPMVRAALQLRLSLLRRQFTYRVVLYRRLEESSMVLTADQTW